MRLWECTSENVLYEASGPMMHAKRNIDTPLSAFLLLIFMQLLLHIQHCTVAEAQQVLNVDRWELSCLWRNYKLSLQSCMCVAHMRAKAFMWRTTGHKSGVFPSSRKQCHGIAVGKSWDSYVLIWEQEEQPDLLQTDFAMASEVWDSFITNSIACYKPGPNITVDEQLFPTKAICRWTQYMANKPDTFFFFFFKF